ncbi:MAG: hypothetical protein MZV65_41605 [Chromatiales bacterium]|nr:hypothetical protein [Chromatiales bacterium]
MAEFGAPLESVSIEDFSDPGVIFQIGVAPRRIDILTAIDAVSFQEAIKDALVIDIEGVEDSGAIQIKSHQKQRVYRARQR